MNLRYYAHKITGVLVLLTVVLPSCAPAKKTGTVTDGLVKGIAVGNDGTLGQLDVELTVKLDDGKEIKATHMVDQNKASSMKGKRVEVEPTSDANLWKVVRVLN